MAEKAKITTIERAKAKAEEEARLKELVLAIYHHFEKHYMEQWIATFCFKY